MLYSVILYGERARRVGMDLVIRRYMNGQRHGAMAVDLVTIGLACADVRARPVDAYPEWGNLALVSHLGVYFGGLAGVTAAAFSRLGGSAAFVGKMGMDGFGDYLINTMNVHGVNTDHVLRTDEESSSATIVLVRTDGERTFFHNPGATTALCEDDIDFDFVSQAKVVHWGGPGVTPGLDGEPMARVFERVRNAGVTTSMDTCYDGEGKWLVRIEPVLPHLDIAMTSLKEAAMYTGQQEPEGIADFFLARGAKVAVVKLGPDGLLVKNEAETHRVPALEVEPVDTTGAGDAACAGFLYGYIQDWGLLESAKLANAVGGLAVQSVGAAEAIESLDQVLALIESG